jgi:O-antigen ligase
MLISIAWSDVSFISFRRWVKELTAVVMALLILTELSPQQALQSLLRRMVYVLIPFSMLLIKYYPYIGVIFGRWSGEIQWIGVTLQKNALGRLCLTAAFFLIWTFRRRWKKIDVAVSKYQTYAEGLLLFLALWLLKGPSIWAASATALYALGVGLTTFFALLWMRKHGIQLGTTVWVIAVGCIIGLGIMTPLLGGSNLAGLTSAVGRDATFTGRTEIWAYYLPYMRREPILGYGFGGFYRVAAEAHNGYLDVWLGLGIVGVFITAMFLMSSAQKAARLLNYDNDWGSLCLCFILMAAVHNITESSFDSFQRQLMAVVLFLSVVVSARENWRSTSDYVASDTRFGLETKLSV